MKKSYLVTIVILALGVAFFSGITQELRGEEPRRAIVAMEMVLGDDFIRPRIYGEPYYNKPPLFNWAIALVGKVVGNFDEWVVRIPSLLFFLLTAFLNFFFVRKLLGRDVALLSSLFFLTSADILFWGSFHSGEIDLFLTLPVYIQVVSMLHFYRKEQYLKMFVMAYLMMAFIFLAKHFAAVFIWVTLLAAFLIHTKNWRIFFCWQHYVGIALFLGICSTYFYAYSLKLPLLPYLENLLFEAAIKTEAEQAGDRLSHTLTYPFNFIKLLLPWSLLGYFLFRKKFFEDLKNKPLLHFSFFFVVINFFAYWLLPETRNRYLYYFFPFTCTLLGWAYIRYTKFQVKYALLLILALAVARIFYNLIVLLKQPPKYKDDIVRMAIEAGDEPIYLSGYPLTYEVGLKIFGETYFPQTITTPPIIPHQIVYYYSNTTGKIMYYDAELKPGRLYLAPTDFFQEKDLMVKDTIPVPWIPNGLLLAKIK